MIFSRSRFPHLPDPLKPGFLPSMRSERSYRDGDKVNFTIPWPPKELNPNSRSHWAAKAKAVKKYRGDCYLLAKNAVGAYTGLTVTLNFRPPNRQRRDLDNALASLKSGLDGIADALNVNDREFKLTLSVGEPIKHGCVEVTL